METNIKQKSAKIYYCSFCDYTSCKKSNFDAHNTAAYHLKNTQGNQMETDGNTNSVICENCNKIYKNRSGLWKHKQKCIQFKSPDNESIEEPIIPDLVDKELIVMLIKQNSEIIKQNTELQGIVLEQNKSITNNQITNMNTNSHNHSHNKTFNLQFFLHLLTFQMPFNLSLPII